MKQHNHRNIPVGVGQHAAQIHVFDIYVYVNPPFLQLQHFAASTVLLCWVKFGWLSDAHLAALSLLIINRE